ncbi:InlB B-repeat-containing protein [Oscillibacter sp. MSJ-2]|uniref:InlB B-repeat-containing protein n=1 Tax=Dysosmobacter acutus TaxID=2841504 RepID=A0ABS6F5X0_9FIRM|nr:InlB B-repeat-containing protein [Dysosmobacter acutus]
MWKSNYTISGTSAGKKVSIVPGVVCLGDTAIDASLSPYQDSSGAGWSGKAADLTLTAEYTGAPIETACDLNLHISGEVYIDGTSGAAVRAGGALYLDFAPGASLTVVGSAGAPAIAAENLWVSMPGALRALGGSGAKALEVTGAMDLSNAGADKSGYQNRLYSGGASIASYGGEREIEIRRPAAEFTFHFEDGATADQTLSTEYDGSALLSAPEPAREGHAFLGWSTDENGLSGTYYTNGGAAPDFAGSRDLYAIWGDDFGGSFVILDGRGKSVTGDGRGACTAAIEDGGALLPEAADWTDQAEYALPSSGVVTDLLWGGQRHALSSGQRLYAVWGTEPYYTFHGNGGTSASGGTMVKASSPDKMAGSVFAKAGQTLGWWTEFPDGTGRAYAPGSAYERTLKTYYTHWVDRRAVCCGSGGTLSGGAVARETDSLPADAYGFTRPGYQFQGWALDRSGSAVTRAEFDAALSAGGPVYLYALWSAVTVHLHNATNCSELKPNADGTYTLPYGRSRSFYTDAFDGWNTKADGSGTWYPYGAVIDPARESAAEFYAFFVDSTQPSVWMTAGRGGFDGKTFLTVSETLPAGFTLPGQVGDRQILAWWFGSFYTDGGFSPRPAVAPGDLVEDWTLRTCFRAVDDGENTDAHARTVQDLNGGVTADGFRLMVSYASLGDLRLAGGDMVFREGYTLKEWNTSADGTGESYLPGARIYKYAGLSKAPRQVFAIWEPTSAPFATVTTVVEGRRVQTPVALGAKMTLPTPERNDDLGFVGWNTDKKWRRTLRGQVYRGGDAPAGFRVKDIAEAGLLQSVGKIPFGAVHGLYREIGVQRLIRIAQKHGVKLQGGNGGDGVADVVKGVEEVVLQIHPAVGRAGVAVGLADLGVEFTDPLLAQRLLRVDAL